MHFTQEQLRFASISGFTIRADFQGAACHPILDHCYSSAWIVSLVLMCAATCWARSKA
jgi:hypothetical protein